MQPDKQFLASQRAADTADAGHSIAIICGGGSFPGAVADAITRRGWRPVMLAIRGWADPNVVERYTHHWVALGQAGRVLRLARAEHPFELVQLDQTAHPRLKDDVHVQHQRVSPAAPARCCSGSGVPAAGKSR
jgi:hypothetical protein